MAPDVTCGAFAVCLRRQNGHFDTGAAFTCQTRRSKHRCGAFDGRPLHRGALNSRTNATFQRDVSLGGAGVTYFSVGDVLNLLMHKSASFCVADKDKRGKFGGWRFCRPLRPDAAESHTINAARVQRVAQARWLDLPRTKLLARVPTLVIF